MSGDIYVGRQFSFVLGQGLCESIRDVAQPLITLRDVLPKYVLKLDPSQFVSGYFRVSQAASTGIDQPTGYTSAKILCGVITSNGRSRVTIISPTHGTKTASLLGTKGATLGDHRSLFSFACDITTVTVSVPSTAQGGDDTLFEYCLWVLPDLTVASSWRDGDIALGYIP